jgi:hypothetical protein
MPFASDRLNIILLWSKPSDSRYVLDKLYIPKWNVQLVLGADLQGGVNQSPTNMLRGVLAEAMRRLPVLWRLTGWIGSG